MKTTLDFPYLLRVCNLCFEITLLTREPERPALRDSPRVEPTSIRNWMIQPGDPGTETPSPGPLTRPSPAGRGGTGLSRPTRDRGLRSPSSSFPITGAAISDGRKVGAIAMRARSLLTEGKQESPVQDVSEHPSTMSPNTRSPCLRTALPWDALTPGPLPPGERERRLRCHSRRPPCLRTPVRHVSEQPRTPQGNRGRPSPRPSPAGRGGRQRPMASGRRSFVSPITRAAVSARRAQTVAAARNGRSLLTGGKEEPPVAGAGASHAPPRRGHIRPRRATLATLSIRAPERQ